ncbi:anhydro-N-acetylmuramic acid kinase [Pseudoxanthomonas sp. CAU 1598]|uniref:Anhydro-N-acetylmuramic acid kinase n=2 Tax=Pseudomarimonas arenosa TaxID=2774145 RepID=A0AAW3ZMQ2_9GAMM|nr:anhydro-N-acetylmuramic acid kinase [Pseudomarimonas arenosa]MBD8527018.1 anhydro-N-acetylmuramic acid kinase [Pseudomarimonas arenosa]
MHSQAAWIGLISGTSADGIDAVLVRFKPEPEVLAARTFAYPAELQGQLVRCGQSDVSLKLSEFAELDHRVGLAFAEAAESILAAAQQQQVSVAAIGSHGQTLRHRPQPPFPFSLQIGDPNLIAERCRLPVVADFRRRDMAAGGQGAPLLPVLHAALLGSSDEDRAVLNLGGIANLTLLSTNAPVQGFDTGPANALMDAWCQRTWQTSADLGGERAQRGQPEPQTLRVLMADPWFERAAPKSSGRDQFHLNWALDRAPQLTQISAEDALATLLQLSVESIAEALQRQQPSCQRLIACGGGVRNPVLMQRLAMRLPQLQVESTAAHGIDPDFVEAIGFAWLAQATVEGRAGNLPSVTGARGPRVLGAVYPA